MGAIADDQVGLAWRCWIHNLQEASRWMTRHPVRGSRRVKAQPLLQPSPRHGGGSFEFDSGASPTTCPPITRQLQVNASGQGIQPLITAQITAQLSYLVTNQLKPSFKPQPQSTAPRHHRLVREGRRSGTRATQPQPQPRLAPGAGSRRLVEPTQFSGQNDHPRAPPGGFCW